MEELTGRGPLMKTRKKINNNNKKKIKDIIVKEYGDPDLAAFGKNSQTV